MGVIRRNHYDVTDSVYLADPRVVSAAACSLLSKHYPGADWISVEHAFRTFGQLYAGTLPGYVGCETWYHDAQHSLDCALVMARLMDGYERQAAPADRLGERRLRLGVIAAMFHDAGYIRKTTDPEEHGAEFTLYHVRRSGDFMAGYLPSIGLGVEVPMVEQMVHFTGYEIALDKIQVEDPKDRLLGFMLGTSDVLAQMSDRCYLEKCRDFLYTEFEICGLAGAPQPDGPAPLYSSIEDLLRRTPEFKAKIWEERLDGYFQGVYRHLDAYFGDRNRYLDVIDQHLLRLNAVLQTKSLMKGLRRRAECINAIPLRQILGITTPVEPTLGARHPLLHNRAHLKQGVDPARYIPT